MDTIFWVIPGRLAGRAGPDEEPWHLPSLHQGGIRAVLSVNDGRLCDPQAFAAAKLAYACHPLSDWVPPQPGDAEHCLLALPCGYDFVQTHLAQRKPVLVHCSGGNDRTGLFVSYVLVRSLGLSPHQAIHQVQQARPTALSAEGWMAFAIDILAHTIVTQPADVDKP